MDLQVFNIFSFTKYARIAEILTLNDVLYWGADTFVTVILALFVTQYIDGAHASSVGIAFMIYRLASSLSTVPIGKMLDTHKGYIDEMWSLFFSSVTTGVLYIMLSFASQLWELYLVMLVIGISRSFDTNAWRILFYSHLEKAARGRTIGTYDAIFGVALGAMAALAGFMGELYGYRIVILVAGIITLISALPILSLKKEKFM